MISTDNSYAVVQVIRLGEADAICMAKALIDPPKPSAALIAAFRRNSGESISTPKRPRKKKRKAK